MESNPLVSIICPAFNHQEFIAETILSIQKQTYKNYEVLIIDDCSTDQTFSIAQSFAKPEVKIWRSPFNWGISNSLNWGIQHANGEILCFLATDDVLDSKHLELVVDRFASNERIGAVYPRLRIIDSKGTYLGLYYAPVIERLGILKSMFLEGNNHLSAPGSCFKRTVFQKIGMFNPALIQTQDFDINVRALLSFEFELLETTSVSYRRIDGKRNISANSPWVQIAFKNELMTVFNSFASFCPEEMIGSIFGKEKYWGMIENHNDAYFALAMIAVNEGSSITSEWGCKTLLDLLAPTGAYESYNSRFGFTFADYIGLYKTKANREHRAEATISQKLRHRVSRIFDSLRKLNKE